MPKFIKFSKTKKVEWRTAPEIKKRISFLIKKLGLEWVIPGQIYCFRSKNSKTRAVARIWGLSRIWQIALKNKPCYIIEIISEKFDRLSKTSQDEILLHEIAHIPQKFSGSLVPHYRKGKRKFNDLVDKLVAQYYEGGELR